MFSNMKKVFSKLRAGWKRIAHAIGRFQTRVIITVFYFLVIGPLGSVMRLLGWDPLDTHKRKAARGTNWRPVRESEPDVESLRRQS